jgi:beta-glucosidase
VLWVGYPGEQGGSAVGEILFGAANPSGRLPVTFPASESDVPDFADYRLQGRGYRYATVDPLYPFGFGLSYTRFRYGAVKLSRRRIETGQSVTASVSVTNVGARRGDEVVQLYVGTDVGGPRWSLRAFRRVSLAPKRSTTVRFEIDERTMAFADERGQRVVPPGEYRIFVGGASPGARSLELGAAKPATAQFRVG